MSCFCVLKKWVHYRTGQCVRPSVYTITLQRFIRLWWNFVHRIVLLESRSREEDENDWSTVSWVIAKHVIIPADLFHGVSPKKTQVSPNRPKGILSCRAWKVVFVVKKSAITIVPLGRYRCHNYSWKSWKFVKNKKNLQICKFCGLDFFHIIWRKWIPNIYPCSSWARALTRILLLILHWYKKFFFW
jgi:hypothetical protein